jgi:tRNA N6-adenosine threonylcarbamoyltransferase
LVRILGIESSCDETAAAVVEDGTRILSSVVESQVALHAPFHGVVPEVASRSHLDAIIPVLDEALRGAGMKSGDVDAIAVTTRPGLIGSLLVGLSAAKALSFVHGKPLLAVHHIEAHIHACTMEHPELVHPFPSLVVSGGHTSLYRSVSPTEHRFLGGTQDDAAGEAFDKVATILGLSYPGGPSIEKAARGGDAKRVPLPRPRLPDAPYEFSFSGLKTAVLYKVQPPSPRGTPAAAGARAGSLDPQFVADLAASFQEAVVDVLVEKTLGAARELDALAIAVGGGVACNGRLRERLTAAAAEEGRAAFFPSKALCLDNAAMIAGLGYHLLREGKTAPLEVDAFPR